VRTRSVIECFVLALCLILSAVLNCRWSLTINVQCASSTKKTKATPQRHSIQAGYIQTLTSQLCTRHLGFEKCHISTHGNVNIGRSRPWFLSTNILITQFMVQLRRMWPSLLQRWYFHRTDDRYQLWVTQKHFILMTKHQRSVSWLLVYGSVTEGCLILPSNNLRHSHCRNANAEHLKGGLRGSSIGIHLPCSFS